MSTSNVLLHGPVPLLLEVELTVSGLPIALEG
jgi:hypothetical protein